jgi:hypothetical protein
MILNNSPSSMSSLNINFLKQQIFNQPVSPFDIQGKRVQERFGVLDLSIVILKHEKFENFGRL